MPASISVQIEPAAVQIQPGGRASARVTLTNKGDAVGQYVLEVQGLDPSWVRVDSSQAGVFPGDKAQIQLFVRPPAEAISATYQVTVFARNQVEAGEQAQGTFSLTVQRATEPTAAKPQPAKPLPTASAADAAQPTVVRSEMASSERPTGPRKPSTSPKPAVTNAPQPVAASVPQPAAKPKMGAAVVSAVSPSGQIQLGADKEGVKVPSGGSQGLYLSLANTGGVAVNLELGVKGPPLSWIKLEPTSLLLAPGENALASLTATIPDQTPVGSYPLAVVVQSGEDASLALRLNMMLEVTRPGELALEISPAQAQGELNAEYTLQVSQSGQAPLNVNLSAKDASGMLEFSITPPSLSVPADGKVNARLSVRSRQAASGGEPLTTVFTVSALPVGGGGQSASAQGRFVQMPPAPVKLLVQPDEVRDAGQAVFQLRMFNPGASPLAYRLSAGDPDNSCTFQFEPPLLNLPPKGEARATLRVTPRSLLNAGEMVHTLRLSARPAEGAGADLSAEVRFIQSAGQPPSLSLNPASQSAPGPVSYWIQVTNPRSVPLQVELRASDPAQQCQYLIDPPSLSIPAMYQASARLDVRPLSDLLAGESMRAVNFSVQGYTGQSEPLIAQGTLLQVPGFTWRKLLPWFIAFIVLLGIGAVVVLALLYMRFMQ
jgi:uncharacterized membrane protein